MKKILIVYYSRTGTTRKVGDILAKKLGTETEEIRSAVDLSGAKGYFLAGRDATLRRLTKIELSTVNLSDYDLVVIGTPIWGWNMSSPIRTYLTEQKDKFKDVAFFCTMGGSGHERAFKEMEGIVSRTPVATLALLTKDVVVGDIEKRIVDFAEKLLLMANE